MDERCDHQIMFEIYLSFGWEDLINIFEIYLTFEICKLDRFFVEFEHIIFHELLDRTPH